MEIRAGSSDIWVYDWKKDMLTRLTSDQAQDARPVWTPDGRRIAFASGRAEKSAPNLYLQSADGAGGALRLTESQQHSAPELVSSEWKIPGIRRNLRRNQRRPDDPAVGRKRRVRLDSPERPWRS